eukprot:10713289-Lingulodinium_polyedra.AAC.1
MRSLRRAQARRCTARGAFFCFGRARKMTSSPPAVVQEARQPGTVGEQASRGHDFAIRPRPRGP